MSSQAAGCGSRSRSRDGARVGYQCGDRRTRSPRSRSGSTSGKATRVPGARIAKAFNHLPPQMIAGDRAVDGGKRVLFYSGEEADAKARGGRLIGQLGFFGIDLDPFASGARLVQFYGDPLPALNPIKLG